MTKSDVSAFCRKCNEPLDPMHAGPCPKCGNIGKQINVNVTEKVEITEHIIVDQKGIRKIQNIKMNALLIVLFIISPIIGYFVEPFIGLIVGFLSGGMIFVIGSYVISRERIHFRYEK